MVSLKRTLKSLRYYTRIRCPDFSSSLNNHLFNYPISLSTFSTPQPYNSSISSLLPSSIFRRSFSDTSQLVYKNVIEEQTELGTPLSEKSGKNGCLVKKLKGEKIPTDSKVKQIKDLKSKLRNLENEVKNLKGIVKGSEKKMKKGILSTREVPKGGSNSNPNSLYSVFTSKPKNINSMPVKNSGEMKKLVISKQERVSKYRESKPLKKENPIKKEISPEMIMFVSRLYEEGYLNDANFLPLKELDLNSLSTHYSRDFLRFTAERFGKDHQEIAKWLSGSELKKVALFGCPSVERKNTFAAKRLRSFFNIQEDTVCRTCKLKNSCAFVNKKVWQKESNLNLPDVMRVLISYDLESIPEELEIPDEMIKSTKKLLKDVINLSM